MYKTNCLGIILNMKIFDLHNDFFTEIKRDSVKEKFLKSSKTLPAKTIVGAVWTSKMKCETALETIEKAHDFMEKHNENNNLDFPKTLLSIEDLHFLSKYNIDRVINANPVSVTLTWNSDNNLAGGAHDGGDLTVFGLQTVETLEQNHIFVDTAHLSEKSFMSFAKITQKPILCSHTACYSLTNNCRNLKDYQLQMVKESGGIVGVCLVSDFLSNMKKATVGDVAKNIDFIVSRFGKEFCALGTDFFGTKKFPKYVETYSALSLLEDRLRFMGYDYDTIEDIFYNNAYNFFKNNK